MIRKIIKIDQDKCEGCGTCITECSKDAIKVIDGKATLVNEAVCDAFGSCVPKCPMYAISLVEEDVMEFDSSQAVNEMLRKMLAGTPPPLPPAAFSPIGHLQPCLNIDMGSISGEENIEDKEDRSEESDSTAGDDIS